MNAGWYEDTAQPVQLDRLRFLIGQLDNVFVDSRVIRRARGMHHE